MGAMLKFPIAENCTMPWEAIASADMGVTVMLCICRLDAIIIDPPPQEAVIRKVIAAMRTSRAVEYLRGKGLRADDLRIDTSNSAEKGKR